MQQSLNSSKKNTPRLSSRLSPPQTTHRFLVWDTRILQLSSSHNSRTRREEITQRRNCNSHSTFSERKNKKTFLLAFQILKTETPKFSIPRDGAHVDARGNSFADPGGHHSCSNFTRSSAIRPRFGRQNTGTKRTRQKIRLGSPEGHCEGDEIANFWWASAIRRAPLFSLRFLSMRRRTKIRFTYGLDTYYI